MKSKEALSKILELLPELSDHGLQEVSKGLKALSQFKRVKLDEVDDYLLEGIFFEVDQIGMRETIPEFFRLRNDQSFNSYGKKSQRIRVMLERHCPDMTPPQKIALGRLLARILREHVQTWRSVDFSILLANIGHLPAAIENEFPGYLMSGALQYVVKALTASKYRGLDDDEPDLSC